MLADEGLVEQVDSGWRLFRRPSAPASTRLRPAGVPARGRGWRAVWLASRAREARR